MFKNSFIVQVVLVSLCYFSASFTIFFASSQSTTATSVPFYNKTLTYPNDFTSQSTYPNAVNIIDRHDFDYLVIASFPQNTVLTISNCQALKFITTASVPKEANNVTMIITYNYNLMILDLNLINFKDTKSGVSKLIIAHNTITDPVDCGKNYDLENRDGVRGLDQIIGLRWIGFKKESKKMEILIQNNTVFHLCPKRWGGIILAPGDEGLDPTGTFKSLRIIGNRFRTAHYARLIAVTEGNNENSIGELIEISDNEFHMQDNAEDVLNERNSFAIHIGIGGGGNGSSVDQVLVQNNVIYSGFTIAWCLTFILLHLANFGMNTTKLVSMSNNTLVNSWNFAFFSVGATTTPSPRASIEAKDYYNFWSSPQMSNTFTAMEIRLQGCTNIELVEMNDNNLTLQGEWKLYGTSITASSSANIKTITMNNNFALFTKNFAYTRAISVSGFKLEFVDLIQLHNNTVIMEYESLNKKLKTTRRQIVGTPSTGVAVFTAFLDTNVTTDDISDVKFIHLKNNSVLPGVAWEGFSSVGVFWMLKNIDYILIENTTTMIYILAPNSGSVENFNSCVRFANGMINVAKLEIRNIHCKMLIRNDTRANAGVMISNTATVRNVGLIHIHSNNVSIVKSDGPYSIAESLFAGISVDTVTPNIVSYFGTVLIENNHVVVRSRMICPPAGCCGIETGFMGLIRSIDSIQIINNHVDVAAPGGLVTAIGMVAVKTFTVVIDGANYPVDFATHRAFFEAGTPIPRLGEYVLKNCTGVVQSLHIASGIAAPISGEVFFGRFVAQDLNFVFSTEVTTNLMVEDDLKNDDNGKWKNDAQVWPAVSQKLKKLGGGAILDSAIFTIGCPMIVVYIEQLTSYFRADCDTRLHSTSKIHFSNEFVMRNINGTGFAAILTNRAFFNLSRATNGGVIENITHRFETKRVNPLSLFSSNDEEYTRLSGLGIALVSSVSVIEFQRFQSIMPESSSLTIRNIKSEVTCSTCNSIPASLTSLEWSSPPVLMDLSSISSSVSELNNHNNNNNNNNNNNALVISNVVMKIICTDDAVTTTTSPNLVLVRHTPLLFSGPTAALTEEPSSTTRITKFNISSSSFSIVSPSGSSITKPTNIIAFEKIKSPYSLYFPISTKLHPFQINVSNTNISLGKDAATTSLPSTKLDRFMIIDSSFTYDDSSSSSSLSSSTMITCLRFNGQVPVSAKDYPISTSLIPPQIAAHSTIRASCQGFVPSATQSQTRNHRMLSPSMKESNTRNASLTVSISLRPIPRPAGLSASTVTSLVQSATIGSALTGFLGDGSPASLLVAARAVSLMQLATCAVNKGKGEYSANIAQNEADARNFTKSKLSADSLYFPLSIIPGLAIGSSPVGGVYRGAILVDLLILFAAMFGSLLLGLRNKDIWKNYVGGPSFSSSKNKNKINHHNNNRQKSEAAAVNAVSIMSVGRFIPIETIIIKVFAILSPFWAEVCGSLLAGLGFRDSLIAGGDAVLALLPIILMTGFLLSCCWHLQRAIFPKNMKPNMSNNDKKIKSVDSGNYSSSSKSDPSELERDENNHNSTSSSSSSVMSQPKLFLEPSSLFVPKGRAGKLVHILSRFFQSKLGTFCFVGNLAWYCPYLDLETNSRRPGPGASTQFSLTLKNYLGPIKNAATRKNEVSRSSHHYHQHHHQKIFSSSFTMTARHLIAPHWTTISVIATMFSKILVGVSNVDPRYCRTFFFIILAESIIMALLLLYVRPFLVQLKNIFVATIEVCATFISGLMFLSLMFAKENNSGNDDGVVIAAQLFATLPGSILGPILLAFVGFRIFVMTVILKGSIVPKIDLRRRVRSELDIVEEKFFPEIVSRNQERSDNRSNSLMNDLLSRYDDDDDYDENKHQRGKRKSSSSPSQLHQNKNNMNEEGDILMIQRRHNGRKSESERRQDERNLSKRRNRSKEVQNNINYHDGDYEEMILVSSSKRGENSNRLAGSNQRRSQETLSKNRKFSIGKQQGL